MNKGTKPQFFLNSENIADNKTHTQKMKPHTMHEVP